MIDFSDLDSPLVQIEVLRFNQEELILEVKEELIGHFRLGNITEQEFLSQIDRLKR